MPAKSSKNAEIIRPILRGRDIKRYKADFADLWLLNVHNGTPLSDPINIDDYPDIKEYLDLFYSGLEKRQDKGITPYNLRSCIYMDDFSKQKIVWKRVGSIIRFCYDDSGCMALDSTCFATGKHIKYLTLILNSKVGNYLLKDSPKTGTGDLLISVQAIEPVKIPVPEYETENRLNIIFDEIINGCLTAELENKINSIVYDLYNLSDEEIMFIELQ